MGDVGKKKILYNTFIAQCHPEAPNKNVLDS